MSFTGNQQEENPEKLCKYAHIVNSIFEIGEMSHNHVPGEIVKGEIVTGVIIQAKLQ